MNNKIYIYIYIISAIIWLIIGIYCIIIAKTKESVTDAILGTILFFSPANTLIPLTALILIVYGILIWLPTKIICKLKNLKDDE